MLVTNKLIIYPLTHFTVNDLATLGPEPNKFRHQTKEREGARTKESTQTYPDDAAIHAV